MTITVTFEDNDNIYTVDFLQLVKKLKITEEQVKKVITEELAK